MSTALPSRPTDATLTVTKAARLLGVHPNTVRAWSDAGRLRYYRINPRGDRRYRLSDLQRFLTAAEVEIDAMAGPWPVRNGPGGRRGGPHHRATGATSSDRRYVAVGRPDIVPTAVDPMANEHHTQALALIDAIARQAVAAADLDDDLAMAASRIRDTFGHHLVAIWELRGDRVVPRAIARADGVAADRLVDRPRAFGVLGAALADAVVGRGAGRRDHGHRRRRRAARGAPRRAHRAGRRHPGRERAVGRPASRRRIDRAVPGPRRRGRLGRRATRSGPSRRPRVAATRPLGSCIAPTPCAGSRATSAAGSISTGSCPGSSHHAMVLFEADRGAVFLRRPDGRTIAEVSRGLVDRRTSATSASSGPARSRRRPSPRDGRSSRSTTATTRAAPTCAPR